MAKGSGKRKIEQYRHEDKQRANNPPAGLGTPATDQDGRPTWAVLGCHTSPSIRCTS